MIGPRLAAITLSVVVALIGVATAPTDGIPVLGNPFEQISQLPAAQETAYLGKHQSVALAMADLDPATTADWWSSTSVDAKEQLIRRYPSIVGNLDGIDYRSRDEANRLQLASSISAAVPPTPASRRTRRSGRFSHRCSRSMGLRR